MILIMWFFVEFAIYTLFLQLKYLCRKEEI
jgi:hypothetical protein